MKIFLHEVTEGSIHGKLPVPERDYYQWELVAVVRVGRSNLCKFFWKRVSK